MVGSSHEAMHRIFHHDLGMLARTFQVLGVDIPAPDAVSLISGDVTEIRPLERRIDTLLKCQNMDGEDYLVVVEAQRSCDADKRYSWMYYLAYLADKYRLPVLLLVVCQDRRVAEWASQPVKRGVGDWPALTLRPLVVGPHNVPTVVDRETAGQDVLLAVFSVLTHANEPEVGAILETLLSTLKAMEDEGKAFELAELTTTGLEDTSAGATWRLLMAEVKRSTLEYWASREGSLTWQLREESREEGRVEGRVEDVLRIADRRGIALSSEQRDRVRGCTDTGQLDRWFDRAIDARTAAEIFDAD